MQTGKNIRVLYKAETSFGVQPVDLTGAKQLRVTPGGGLKLGRTRIDSREVRSDGQSWMPRLGQKSVTGSYAGEITAGTWDDFFQALLRGTWTLDALTPGSTARSFYVEEQHLDIDTSKVFDGVTVGSARVSLAPDGIATVEFGLVGRDGDVLEGVAAPVFTAPYTATTGEPMTAVDAAITLEGVPVLDFTACDFTIDRRASGQATIGSDTTPAVYTNNLSVEGSISAIRTDATRQTEFLAETISTLVITLEDPAGATLTFTMEIKFVDYADNLGDDNAMISTLPFVAGVHAGGANMIAMSRTAA